MESYRLFGSIEGNAGVYNPALSAAANRTAVNARRPLGKDYQALFLGKDIGTSSYSALVVSLEKRMTQGLSILAGYRWSKCLDENETAPTFSANAYSSLNPLNDHGPCGYNVPNQLRFSYACRIPAPRSVGFFGRHVLGGWE